MIKSNSYTTFSLFQLPPKQSVSIIPNKPTKPVITYKSKIAAS